MNAKGCTKIVAGIMIGGVVGLACAVLIAGLLGWLPARWYEPLSPAIAVPTLQAPELIILASGSGVTVLEYQGAGVRCIIASGASVDMVCQNSATVPVQPTPTEMPKHQIPNGSSEA